MIKRYSKTLIAGLAFLALSLLCRFFTPLADGYALYLYPVISAVLSWVSLLFPFPLQEAIVVVLVFIALVLPFIAWRRHWGARRCVRYELTLLLWTYIGFYWGWAINYSRSNLYQRSGTVSSEFNETRFRTFLQNYTDSLNASWTPNVCTDKETLEHETKAFYATVPSHYGLAAPRSWHHPKPMLFNRLYSAVGVSGFMAPLLGESCVNRDLLPNEYPFVYAHEYAHILGISGEAEANWWAFQACVRSPHQSVRYAGYKGILTHVAINARHFLPAEDYKAWFTSLRPEVIRDLETSRDHWQQLRLPWFDTLQGHIYDLFLKGNNVKDGTENYSAVVQLLMDVKLE